MPSERIASITDGRLVTLTGQKELKTKKKVVNSLNDTLYSPTVYDNNVGECMELVNYELYYVFSDDTIEASGDHVEQTQLTGQQLVLTQWVQHRWKHLFKGIDRTAGVLHHIHTGDARPVQARGKPIPIGLHERIRLQIDEMLRDGVIECTNSEWHSPIRPVEKPNGDIRLAINYR